LGAARANKLLEDTNEYTPRDLGMCLRLMRYRPLEPNEFAYESGKEPHVQLNPQRERDFMWRFMRELRELEEKLKNQQQLSQMGPTAQLVRFSGLYEGAPENATGIWDRHYRGRLPPVDDPGHLYWPGRAAVAAVAALLMYARTVPLPVEEDREGLQKYARLISFWAGALGRQLVVWSAPQTLHGPAAELAQLLVQGVVAMICGEYIPRVPEVVRTPLDMADVMLADAARGASAIPFAEFDVDRKTLEEIKNFLALIRV